jgi:hypothetical protein
MPLNFQKLGQKLKKLNPAKLMINVVLFFLAVHLVVAHQLTPQIFKKYVWLLPNMVTDAIMGAGAYQQNLGV